MAELKQHHFKNLYWIHFPDGKVRLATKNADPGKKVYTERLVNIDGTEYRVFDPYKSKLGAGIRNDLRTFPFKDGVKILYLGAASGTTVSHVSDIIGEDGEIYAIEFSARSLRDLVTVAERRKNIIPILSDARYPETYSFTVPIVDVIFEDVAQPFQTEILWVNVKSFLKKGGYFFLAVKARSIDVTKNPKVIFEEVKKEILDYGLEIIEEIDLAPYEKDHILFIGKKP
ncbi:MAG: fibrillarin-like rRNA/tRNA 2'-O-methyltransferase [Candidatus Heimdallarchaeaceae archaeon]